MKTREQKVQQELANDIEKHVEGCVGITTSTLLRSGYDTRAKRNRMRKKHFRTIASLLMSKYNIDWTYLKEQT